MSTITKVALLGKGFLGSAILTELLAANFSVTVITRSPSASPPTLPPGATLVSADYTSLSSLTAALRSHHAAISTIAARGTASQHLIIDACLAASVRRFVPSDWGSFTTDPTAQRTIPSALDPTTALQLRLRTLAAEGRLEYTVFSVGAFTDVITRYPVAFDYANKRATLWDGGRHAISTTSVAGIGRAVAGALRNAPATKNRNVKVHELVVTQRQLLDLAKRFSPPGAEWTVDEVDGAEEFERAYAMLLAGPHDEDKVVGVIKAGLFSGRFESAYAAVDNDVVGLEMLTEEDLEARFAAIYGV